MERLQVLLYVYSISQLGSNDSKISIREAWLQD
jgi:hypothetical protein